MIGSEDGAPHVVKRADRPRIHMIPETVGSGALSHDALHDAARQLPAHEAGLIVVADATLADAIDQAVTRAARVVRRRYDPVDRHSDTLMQARQR